MKKKTTVLLVVVVAVVALLAVGKNKKQQAQANASSEPAEPTFAVNVEKAVAQTFDNYLEFSGDVQLASSVDIYPDVQLGKITRLLVKNGDVVTKNQVVAEVDASRAGQDYRSSPVKAPVGGTITSFPLKIGATVGSSTSIGKVSSTGRLEVKTHVAERYVSRVRLGQDAMLTFDAYPGEEFPARVTEVDPTLDAASRTLGMKLVQDPPDPRLLAGMFSKIHLITDTHENTIVIARTTIVEKVNGQFVFIADPSSNTARMTPIKTGITVDDKIEITEGIHEGDLVVTKGNTMLNDGAKIKIMN